MLDAVRIGPGQDATAVTAAQLREVVDGLIAARRWRAGDLPILIVADAGYDLSTSDTWWTPAHTTATDTHRYGRVVATAWDGLYLD